MWTYGAIGSCTLGVARASAFEWPVVGSELTCVGFSLQLTLVFFQWFFVVECLISSLLVLCRKSVVSIPEVEVLTMQVLLGLLRSVVERKNEGPIVPSPLRFQWTLFILSNIALFHSTSLNILLFDRSGFDHYVWRCYQVFSTVWISSYPHTCWELAHWRQVFIQIPQYLFLVWRNRRL